jgi:phosphoadenosine phosphosulfate reductase
MKEYKAINIINNLKSNNIVMTSSFGMQSAVLIHLIQQSNKKHIPIIFLDTQYLFNETYYFLELLKNRFNLHIKTYQASITKIEQEKKYNKLWETNLSLYNNINKIEPMKRALSENNVEYWISGIRSSQSENRKNKILFEKKENYTKVHPLLDWTDQDIFLYLKKHNLPYHPLREKGYLSIGDWHSTKSIYEINDISEIRFNGKQRECGLHI